MRQISQGAQRVDGRTLPSAAQEAIICQKMTLISLIHTSLYSELFRYQTEWLDVIRYHQMGLSENSVPHCTQWFSWSLSQYIPIKNGYFIGGIPHFQTYPHDQPYEIHTNLVQYWVTGTNGPVAWDRQMWCGHPFQNRNHTGLNIDVLIEHRWLNIDEHRCISPSSFICLHFSSGLMTQWIGLRENLNRKP